MAGIEVRPRSAGFSVLAFATQALLGLLMLIAALLAMLAGFLMVREAATESYYYQNVWGFYRFETAAVVVLLVFGGPAAVALTAWIWRAYANLIDRNTQGLSFSPGWAALSIWLPFINLVVPMRAMRELWNFSHGEIPELSRQSVGLVTAWWTCFLIAVVIQPLLIFIVLLPSLTGIHITSLPGANFALFCVSGVMLALACWNLARIVARISRAQNSSPEIGTTFD